MNRLLLIGYWRGAGPGDNDWPDVREFVDSSWDARERRLVSGFLRLGAFAPYMCAGFSTCRFCGMANGSREQTDGSFIWPDGLAHYLERRDVRLPAWFVDHALASIDAMTDIDVDESWWRSVQRLGDQRR